MKPDLAKLFLLGMLSGATGAFGCCFWCLWMASAAMQDKLAEAGIPIQPTVPLIAAVTFTVAAIIGIMLASKMVKAAEKTEETEFKGGWPV